MATQFSINDGRKWKFPFYSMWGGQKLSLLGSQLVSFGIIWYLTETFESATILSLASLAGLLPQVVLAPFVGPLIDRWNRKNIMIVADAIIAIFTLVLSFLFLFDSVQIWHIFVVLFIRSVAGGFHYNASFSTTPLMVPKERLTNVNGLDQAFNGALNIIGAPLGAIFLELIDVQGVLWIDVVTALIAIGILIFVKIPNPERNHKNEENVSPLQSYFKDLKIGLRYMATWRGMLYLMFFAIMLNFTMTPAFSLLSLLVTEHFMQGVIELGIIQSIFGVGVLVGGLLMGAWGGFKQKMLTTMTGVLMMGAGMMAIGLSPQGMIWFGYVSMVLIGFGMVITNAPINGATQEVVHPEMQGRVHSLLGSMTQLGTPIGLIIAGPVSDWIGINTWYWITGVIFILSGFMIPVNKHLMNLTNGHPRQDELAEEFGLSKQDPESVE